MDNRTANALQTAAVSAETEPVKAETAEVTFVDNTAEKGTSEEAFMDFEKMQEALRPYTVLIPEEYRKQRYEGELWGYYHPETKTYNIVQDALYDARTDAKALGMAVRKEHTEREAGDISGQFGLSIVWNEEQAEIFVRDNSGAEINMDYYSTRQDVFSRNQGIVEQDRMAAKQAIISGTGSGGIIRYRHVRILLFEVLRQTHHDLLHRGGAVGGNRTAQIGGRIRCGFFCLGLFRFGFLRCGSGGRRGILRSGAAGKHSGAKYGGKQQTQCSFHSSFLLSFSFHFVLTAISISNLCKVLFQLEVKTM